MHTHIYKHNYTHILIAHTNITCKHYAHIHTQLTCKNRLTWAILPLFPPTNSLYSGRSMVTDVRPNSNRKEHSSLPDDTSYTFYCVCKSCFMLCAICLCGVCVCVCLWGEGGVEWLAGYLSILLEPIWTSVMLWESLVPKSSLLVCPFCYVGYWTYHNFTFFHLLLVIRRLPIST